MEIAGMQYIQPPLLDFKDQMVGDIAMTYIL